MKQGNTWSSVLSSNLSIAFGVFLVSYNLTLPQVGKVTQPYFDEHTYVSAARQFILQGANENWSHPPFGKFIISLGMRIFGDTPLGWRFSSVISGSIVLAIIYLLGIVLFESRKLALVAVFLSAINHILFVESRAAVLEAPMAVFILAGLLFFTHYWIKNKSSKFLFLSGSMFGLGAAVKWFSIVPWFLCVGLLFVKKLLPGLTDISPKPSPPRPTWQTVFGFTLALIVSYFSAYTVCINLSHPSYGPTLQSEVKAQTQMKPSLPHSQETTTPKQSRVYQFLDFIGLQRDMLFAQKKFYNPTHLAKCSWYDWPFMKRVSWYLYPYSVTEGTERKQGIGLFGNPIVMWFGFFATLFCLSCFIREKSAKALLLSWFYFGMWLCWIVIPRQTAFYYYYFPSSLILCLALVFAADRLRLSKALGISFMCVGLIFFIYSYPLLTASPLSIDEFNKRHYVVSFGQAEDQY